MVACRVSGCPYPARRSGKRARMHGPMRFGDDLCSGHYARSRRGGSLRTLLDERRVRARRAG
jgi:hypothetical protein